jgi:hypothetical protein
VCSSLWACQLVAMVDGLSRREICFTTLTRLTFLHTVLTLALAQDIALLCFHNFAELLSIICLWLQVAKIHKIYIYRDRNQRHALSVFNLLWFNSLYMFRTLLAHLQEALHKQQLVYRVRIMSVGCYHSNPGSNQQTSHARNIPIVFCAAPPEDEHVVLETCTGC